jgi:hypothetical protein
VLFGWLKVRLPVYMLVMRFVVDLTSGSAFGISKLAPKSPVLLLTIVILVMVHSVGSGFAHLAVPAVFVRVVVCVLFVSGYLT